jgi:hypothetical protein
MRILGSHLTLTKFRNPQFVSAFIVVEEFRLPWIQRLSFCFVVSALVVVEEFQLPWIQRFSFCYVVSALVVVEEFRLPWIQRFSFCYVVSALVVDRVHWLTLPNMVMNIQVI